VDGEIVRPPGSSGTITAIEIFQKRFMAAPDGVISVNGRTWRELIAIVGDEAPADGLIVDAGGFFFPFATLPKFNWTAAPRSFGANRSGGKRAHAGCDLYFPLGTLIHAIGDGKVVRGPYDFYCQTFAIEVDHGDFIARYGEVQKSALVKTGDTIRGGQPIAKVGHLVGISVPSDMLHLEIYDKSGSGPLTVTASSASKKRADGIPFFRRKDLVDPTTKLNLWKGNLAGG
ncbi:MAG: M23 family metallopeptidase, partial [Bacteroidota bacterium]